MFRKTAALSLALISLAGCQRVEKLMGWPHRLDNAEAAARYLDIACPRNLEGEHVEQKNNKDVEQYKAGKLTNQQVAKLWDSYVLAIASLNLRSAQAKTDPGFIWPESVRSLVAEMSAAEMEGVSALREFVRQGGFTAASREEGPWPDIPSQEAKQRAADKASAIRAALRLPARREGCKDGKRALTLEQIKKLQGA